jgi:hypothetical protein
MTFISATIILTLGFAAVWIVIAVISRMLERH